MTRPLPPPLNGTAIKRKDYFLWLPLIFFYKLFYSEKSALCSGGQLYGPNFKNINLFLYGFPKMLDAADKQRMLRDLDLNIKAKVRVLSGRATGALIRGKSLDPCSVTTFLEFSMNIPLMQTSILQNLVLKIIESLPNSNKTLSPVLC